MRPSSQTLFDSTGVTTPTVSASFTSASNATAIETDAWASVGTSTAPAAEAPARTAASKDVRRSLMPGILACPGPLATTEVSPPNEGAAPVNACAEGEHHV